MDIENMLESQKKGGRKPVIAIVPLVDAQRDSYWMLPGYMEGISLAGGIPVMLPVTWEDEDIRQIAQEFDGFLFTGGQDVEPAVYGEEKLKVCAECCPVRDKMETKLLPEVLKLDKPVLGICRGLQFINAALGGTLYQDIVTQKPSGLTHRQPLPYDMAIHEDELVENTPIHQLLQKKRIGVNSLHHQAIKDLAGCLSPMAYAEDGLVEAVYMPGKKYVWAVQWHPEFSFKVNEDSVKIFESFVNASAE